MSLNLSFLIPIFRILSLFFHHPMIMRLAYLMTTFLLFATFTAQAQWPLLHSPGTYRVIALSGLNMRTEASLAAKPVAKLPYGSEIQLIQEKREEVKVGWMNGFWAQVRYGEKTGYVYSPYLTHLPLPRLDNHDDVCFHEVYGFENLLTQYIKQNFQPEGEARKLYSPFVAYDDETKTVHSQWYSNNIQVISTGYYESSSTAIRIPGMDVFQAFAFLETLVSSCPEVSKLIKEVTFIKDPEGKIIEIRDPEYGGYNFRIRQVDPGTAEIQMSSGV